MTDKEFKRLSRAQLIEIIYQLQIKMDALSEENQRLTAELADKRLRMSRAGNIAEAALGICNVMQSAQEAATLYLEEIRMMREETKEECERLLKEAQKEADAIRIQAPKAKQSVTPEWKTSRKKKHKRRK